MKTFALTIAASMALAGPAVAAQAEPPMAEVMVAAGALITLEALCPDYLIDPKVRAHLAHLENQSRRVAAYGVFFDRGVATMTAEALSDPRTCADAIAKNQQY